MTMKIYGWPAACAALVAAYLLFGPVAATRAQEFRVRPPEELTPQPLAQGQPPTSTNVYEVAEPSPSGDLGRQVLLQRRARLWLVRLTSDTEFQYDSNVLLTDKNRISDGLLFQTFSASVSADLIQDLTSTLYARYHLARYDEHTELDFDANVVGLNLNKQVRDWFTAYGDFSATRTYLSHGDDEFFKMYDGRFGLWRSQPMGTFASLAYGYQVDWRPSSPSRFTRVDNNAYIDLKLKPAPKFSVDLLYRIRFEDYLQVNRKDLNHLGSLSLTYVINDYIAARAFASYGLNDSDASGFDYRVFDGGGGANISIKF